MLQHDITKNTPITKNPDFRMSPQKPRYRQNPGFPKIPKMGPPKWSFSVPKNDRFRPPKMTQNGHFMVCTKTCTQNGRFRGNALHDDVTSGGHPFGWHPEVFGVVTRQGHMVICHLLGIRGRWMASSPGVLLRSHYGPKRGHFGHPQNPQNTPNPCFGCFSGRPLRLVNSLMIVSENDRFGPSKSDQKGALFLSRNGPSR